LSGALSDNAQRTLDMGVAPPKAFPKELDFEESDEEESDEEWDLIDENHTHRWSIKSTNRSPMSMVSTLPILMS
jgi:hypothetical protein